MGKFTRRLFLGTGLTALAGLAVGTGWLARLDIRGTRSTGPRGTAQRLNAFIEILPDGRVRALVPRAEMGQGAQTGFATLLAEELEIPLSKITVEHPTELLPAYINTVLAVGKRPEHLDGPIHWTAQRIFSAIPYIGTGGSTTIVDAWVPARVAGATARRMLAAAAAKKWGVPANDIIVADGIISHPPTERTVHFGELAAEAARETPPEAPELKPPEKWKLIGSEGLQRVDLPAKVTGSAQFGVDIKLPGMKVGTLLHAPKLGALLGNVDDSAIAALPGAVQIVRGKDYVAAVADSYWYAKQALAALKIQWTGGATLDDAAVSSTLEAGLGGQGADSKEFRNDGHAESAIGGAARKLEAHYRVPYLAHACMEPMNATAWLRRARCWVVCRTIRHFIRPYWAAASGAAANATMSSVRSKLLWRCVARRSS
jgi:isoquinoline 1-oxidoreductase subunit beta